MVSGYATTAVSFSCAPTGGSSTARSHQPPLIEKAERQAREFRASVCERLVHALPGPGLRARNPRRERAMSKRGNQEGSVYKRKDGRWVGVLHLGYANGKRQRKYYYGE